MYRPSGFPAYLYVVQLFTADTRFIETIKELEMARHALCLLQTSRFPPPPTKSVLPGNKFSTLCLVGRLAVTCSLMCAHSQGIWDFVYNNTKATSGCKSCVPSSSIAPLWSDATLFLVLFSFAQSAAVYVVVTSVWEIKVSCSASVFLFSERYVKSKKIILSRTKVTHGRMIICCGESCSVSFSLWK